MANWLFIFTVPWVSTKPGNRTSHPKTPWTGCTHKPFSQLTTRCDQWNDSASQSNHVPVLFMPSYRSLYCFKPSSLRSLWRSHLIPGKGNTPWLFLCLSPGRFEVPVLLTHVKNHVIVPTQYKSWSQQHVSHLRVYFFSRWLQIHTSTIAGGATNALQMRHK